MSSDNPFAPPVAPLQDPPVSIGELATRGSRVRAAIIDGLILLPFLWPLFRAFAPYLAPHALALPARATRRHHRGSHSRLKDGRRPWRSHST